MHLPTSLAKFIWIFIKRQKYSFITIQVMAVAWSIDNTLWPYAFKFLIDKIISFSGDKSEIWYILIPVLIFWGGLWLLIEIMFRIQGFVMAKALPRFEADIRMAMFKYVEDHSYDFFASNFAGSIANKISDMTQSATRIAQMIMTLFVPALLALIIAGGIFFSISPLFTVILVGWACLHMGICLLGAKKCASLSNAHATSRSFLTGKIVDTFTNIINVKLFTKQRFEYNYIDGYQETERSNHQTAQIAVEKIKIALGLSSFIFPGVLITWYQIYSWQHDLISIGDLVLIFYTTNNIVMLAWITGLELPNLFKRNRRLPTSIIHN